ncbi:MAG: GNAT family N-acetyltransferase [Rhodoglobus sp.]
MTVDVVNNPETGSYDLVVDGDAVGHAYYEHRGDTLVFTHTEIDKDDRLKGLGSRLVEAALDDVRASSTKRIVAECPFVAHFIRANPEYQDLLER